MLIKVLILFLLSVFGYDCAVLSSPIKYIGKSYSVEEYEKLDICELEVCKKDAEKFLSLASHENNSDACASLEEFSCGNFIKFGATKYTSNFNGVEMDVDAEFSDYLKIVLEEEIREDEPKIVKLVKKYHQNCVSPDYDGKAEFKSLLNEFGKFPIFEDNWEPSDFNVTKAFILGENNFLKTSVISQNHGISIFMEMEPFNYFFNESSILELLRDDLKLSNNISSEISLNFRDYKDQVYEGNFYTSKTTVQDLDSFLNIKSGLDWLKIFKSIHKNDDINNDTVVSLDFSFKILSKIFDLKNRRILANMYTLNVLGAKIEYFPNHKINSDSSNIYKKCIGHLISSVNFPLEVIFQMKYKNDKSLKAFKDFVDKFKALQGSNDNYTQIGFPDELTTKEFLDNLYADLSLTGEEGLYKIRQEMKVYSNLIHHDEYNPVHIESLSENARSIFKNCGKNQKDCSRNSSFFKVMDTFYPMFHPDRPYFINMVYTGKKIRVGLNFQSHYTKYLEKFGPEQNIPGFLMKNKQMILMIERQQRCSEEDPHSFLRGPSFYIFDCVSVYD